MFYNVCSITLTSIHVIDMECVAIRIPYFSESKKILFNIFYSKKYFKYCILVLFTDSSNIFADDIIKNIQYYKAFNTLIMLLTTLLNVN